MAKGRHLKTEFWTDKNIVQLTPLARLLYLGLWNYAHDCGHLDDEPLELKMRLLPADNCDVDELLQELADHGRIIRKDGVLDLPKLAEHQKPDKRWFTRCPPCKEAHEHAEATTSNGGQSTPNTTRPPSAHHEATTRPPGDHHADVDVDVELMGIDGVTAPAAKAATKKKPAIRLSADWEPTDEHRKRCADEGIVIASQVARFKAHAEANDRRQVNWNAAFTQWLLNIPEWQRQGSKPARNLSHAATLEQPPDGLSPEEYAAWAEQQRRRA